MNRARGAGAHGEQQRVRELTSVHPMSMSCEHVHVHVEIEFGLEMP